MEIDVTFTHPRTSDIFLATVGLGVTAQQAIQELISPTDKHTKPFLSPVQKGSEYQIIDGTGVAILPQMTFGNANVANGDTLDIVLNAKAG